MVANERGLYHRGLKAFAEELERIRAEREVHISDVHSWCPHCSGRGNYPGPGGIKPCPNTALHRAIDEASVEQPYVMGIHDAAEVIGLHRRTLAQHMARGTLRHQLIGGVAVFSSTDVLDFRRAYWYPEHLSRAGAGVPTR